MTGMNGSIPVVMLHSTFSDGPLFSIALNWKHNRKPISPRFLVICTKGQHPAHVIQLAASPLILKTGCLIGSIETYIEFTDVELAFGEPYFIK